MQQLQLDLRDVEFITSERFLYQLATLIPHLTNVEHLCLQDLTKIKEQRQQQQIFTNDNTFLCWWTDENELLLVEALERNFRLLSFDFCQQSRGTGGSESTTTTTTTAAIIPILSPDHLKFVESQVLQRNQDLGQRGTISKEPFESICNN